MSETDESEESQKHKVNGWEFLQTVLVAALDKGQLPAMFLGLGLLIVIWKLPSDQIIPFVERLLDVPKFFSILGWILALFAIPGAYYVTRFQKRVHKDEIRRIAKEKKFFARTVD